jgi:hypothetical protein
VRLRACRAIRCRLPSLQTRRLPGAARCGHERGERADANVNDGLFVRWGASQPFMGCATVARGFKMNTRVTVTIKIDVAAILLRIAAIVAILVS